MSELNSTKKLWRWQLTCCNEIQFGLCLGADVEYVMKSLKEKFPKASNIEISPIEFDDEIVRTGSYYAFMD